MKIEEVLGKTVVGTAGYYIGDVSNIEIDAKTWQITHLHFKLSDKAAKEFGLKKPLKSSNARIPIAYIKDIGVIITLNQTLIELKKTLFT